MTVDPLALELIERCARTLSEWGLEDFIDELSDREAWRAGVWQTETIRGVLLIKLGPMTELFLWECLDVASRPGWSEPTKRVWLLQVMDAIGFRRSVPSAEPTSD